MKPVRLAAYGPNTADDYTVKVGPNSEVRVYHHHGDPASVRRCVITTSAMNAVVLPSKGLTLLQATPASGLPFFWEPPLDTLPDPESIDLNKTVLVGGKPVEGMGWIEYFCGGVEFMGLENWGLAARGKDGILPLHGNVSNNPVSLLTVGRKEEYVILSGEFLVRGASEVFVEPDAAGPDYRVVKEVLVSETRAELRVRDTIVNISQKKKTPDWGYHVQLRPEPGCRLSIPSEKVKKRFGGEPEQEYSVWRPAEKEGVREERGYIHTSIKEDRDVPGCFSTTLEYPGGQKIQVTLPLSPFVLSWYSCGGKDGDEFLIPGEVNKRLLKKGWNGVGPEIGASSLDHRGAESGDCSSGVNAEILRPGESLVKELIFRGL